MYKRESFSSFPDIKELDKIPTLYLNCLIQLGPIIKFTTEFIDILIWKNTSNSLLAVLLWMTICCFTQVWLVFGLPCLYFVIRAWTWFQFQMQRKHRETIEVQQKQQIEESAKLLKQKLVQQHEQDLFVSRGIQPNDQILLQDTLSRLQYIQSWWTHSYWKSLYYPSLFTMNLVTLTSALVYVWPIWIILNHFICGSHGIIMLTGIWVLVSNSSWYQMMIYALRKNYILLHMMKGLMEYNIALMSYYLTPTKAEKPIITNMEASLPPSPTSSPSHETYRCEVTLIFQVYENQRWWLGLDWTTNLLPSEREPWTDNQLQGITSKEEYKLPKEKITHTLVDGEKRITFKSYVWTDRDWWIDMTGELDGLVDKNGWEYGNNSWLHLMPMPGPNTFTRQRKWCRRAKLVEKQIAFVEEQQEEK